MSSTILELTRATQEDLERYQENVMHELDYQPKVMYETVYQSTMINAYLDKILETKDKIIEIYEDKEGSRKEELNKMSGAGPTLYSLFYDRLRELKDYHRKFPNVEVTLPEVSVTLDEDSIMPQFSGEERYGKHVDLHEFYDRWNSLQHRKIPDYFTYVERFDRFTMNIQLKITTPDYRTYLEDLYKYFVDFAKKVFPLFELEAHLTKLRGEFQQKWTAGDFDTLFENYGKAVKPIVKKNSKKNEKPNEKDQKKDTQKERTDKSENNRNKKKQKREDKKEEKKDDKKEPAKVKQENGASMETENLYCEHCDKYFAKTTVFQAHFAGKKHQQNVQNAGQQKGAQVAKAKERYHVIAEKEFLIQKLVRTVLSEQIDNTKMWITKKLARTYKELEEELHREEMSVFQDDSDSESEEDDELEIKTTIENYPVGWDGKPIPYWLYKLHGLGVEYKCEICGNFSYWGRKAYEKHFQEWRHAHGMRCLGIPNSKHFQDITKINDALALWGKIRKDNTFVQWKPEVEEEFEDKDGNVFNRKTYDDLKRQGLLY